MGLQRVKHGLATEQEARSLIEAELGMLGEVERCHVWHPGCEYTGGHHGHCHSKLHTAGISLTVQ